MMFQEDKKGMMLSNVKANCPCNDTVYCGGVLLETLSACTKEVRLIIS